MKRKPKLAGTDSVSEIRPLFIWHSCFVCRQEFRREWAWRLFIKEFYLGHGAAYSVVRFACRDCCPDFASALALRNKIKTELGDWVP
jgi:hypothetical protein